MFFSLNAALIFYGFDHQHEFIGINGGAPAFQAKLAGGGFVPRAGP